MVHRRLCLAGTTEDGAQAPMPSRNHSEDGAQAPMPSRNHSEDGAQAPMPSRKHTESLPRERKHTWMDFISIIFCCISSPTSFVCLLQRRRFNRNITNVLMVQKL